MNLSESYKDPLSVFNEERKLNLFFDIDDTITRWNDNRDYSNFEPIHEMVQTINMLYDKGHHITLYTSRGMKSCGPNKIQVEIVPALVENLNKIGLKYNELVTHKPRYDLFVDDKCVNPKTFLEFFNKENQNENI